MKTYQVTYEGNSKRFSDLSIEINAYSEKEAVRTVFAQIMSDNCFPQEDGSIKDCDGHTIADPEDNYISHDGGYFSAEEI